MKRLLLLSTILCGPGFGAVMGTCVSTTLSSLVVGDPCALGDKTFSNFTYTGNVDASNVMVDFQMAADSSQFRLILTPVSASGPFTNFTLTDTIAVMPGVAPNIAPANYQLIGVKDQASFSTAQGSVGLLVVANSPGATFDLIPGDETGDPAYFTPTSSVTTTSTLSGTGGTGDSSPGLSSLELDYFQANTAVPEPSTWGLVGLALACAGLLRKRIAQF